MHRLRLPVLLLTLVWGGPAAAQDLASAIPDNPTDVAGITSAAKAVSGAGADKLLVKDFLGKTLKGSDGTTIGTVENLAVIPGGRVVAALVSTGDGTTLAVPFTAIKLVNAAGTAGLQVPVTASELKGIGALKSLANSLTD